MGCNPSFILQTFARIDLIELFIRVGADICGVIVTFSWNQKGCSCGKGSSLKTSNVHPDNFPLSSALSRSLSSINPPLPALIKTAPFLTVLRELELIMFLVCAVSGNRSIR